MKTANTLKTILTLIIITAPLTYIFAEELDSTNYKIVGATTNSGGGMEDSTNYSVIGSTGEISADPRNYSTNYRLDQDPSANFVAAQPTVQCFETTTDGTTDCTSGPAELLTGGMVAICGPGGCYNKARFEINPNQNPTDTLYSIEISTDNFVSNLEYIDGSTFRPESSSNHDINDFRTETVWETEDFNIQGLISGTQYYIRITALHGDFTQSDYSFAAETTTAGGTISFDIDIATSSGTTTESASPYSISFSGSYELVSGAAAMTAPNLIWLDIESSADGGVAVLQAGDNGGLTSPTTSQTITSATANLDDVDAGFGLQSFYIDYDDSSSFYGDLTTTTNYSGSINNVGIINTSNSKIYDGDGPIVSGRVALEIIAKAGTDKTSASDYTENIHFVLIPRY